MRKHSEIPSKNTEPKRSWHGLSITSCHLRKIHLIVETGQAASVSAYHFIDTPSGSTISSFVVMLATIQKRISSHYVRYATQNTQILDYWAPLLKHSRRWSLLILLLLREV